MGTEDLLQAVDGRGPRYAVSGTIRPGEHFVDYAPTRDIAERAYQRRVDERYAQVRLHPPDGEVDLEALGRARREALSVLAERTAVLRAGVLRALEAPGASETTVARQAGVSRGTVREWAGK